MIHIKNHSIITLIFFGILSADVSVGSDTRHISENHHPEAVTGESILPVFRDSDSGNRVSVNLLTKRAKITEPGTYWVGFQMKIRDGWHVYWRNPGDSGLPTEIEWEDHDYITAGPIHWPRPERFDEEGVTTYGYSNEVILLVPLNIAREESDMSASSTLSANVNWLVCKEICLPESTTATLETGADGTFQNYSAGSLSLFEKAEALLPEKTTAWRAEAAYESDQFEITVTPESGETAQPDVENIYFFSGTRSTIDHTAPQRARWVGDDLVMTLQASRYLNAIPGEISGVLISEESWFKDKEVTAMDISFSVSSRYDSE